MGGGQVPQAPGPTTGAQAIMNGFNGSTGQAGLNQAATNLVQSSGGSQFDRPVSFPKTQYEQQILAQRQAAAQQAQSPSLLNVLKSYMPGSGK